jgi:hypothetical protein
MPFADCLRGLISGMQGLQHLVPAKPFLLWGEVPANDTENGNSSENHAGLWNELNRIRISTEFTMDKRTYEIEIFGIDRENKGGNHDLRDDQ